MGHENAVTGERGPTGVEGQDENDGRLRAGLEALRLEDVEGDRLRDAAGKESEQWGGWWRG